MNAQDVSALEDTRRLIKMLKKWLSIAPIILAINSIALGIFNKDGIYFLAYSLPRRYSETAFLGSYLFLGVLTLIYIYVNLKEWKKTSHSKDQ